MGWALIQYDRCPYKKKLEHTERDPWHGHTQRKGHVGTQEAGVIRKSSREASGETKPADTLILDFQPPEL